MAQSSFYGKWQALNMSATVPSFRSSHKWLTHYLAVLATIGRSVLIGLHVYAFHHERMEHEQRSDVRDASMSSQIHTVRLTSFTTAGPSSLHLSHKRTPATYSLMASPTTSPSPSSSLPSAIPASSPSTSAPGSWLQPPAFGGTPA